MRQTTKPGAQALAGTGTPAHTRSATLPKQQHVTKAAHYLLCFEVLREGDVGRVRLKRDTLIGMILRSDIFWKLAQAGEVHQAVPSALTVVMRRRPAHVWFVGVASTQALCWLLQHTSQQQHEHRRVRCCLARGSWLLELSKVCDLAQVLGHPATAQSAFYMLSNVSNGSTAVSMLAGGAAHPACVRLTIIDTSWRFSASSRGHACGCCVVETVLHDILSKGRVCDRAQDLPCVNGCWQRCGWDCVGEGAGHRARDCKVAQQACCADDVILGQVLGAGAWVITAYGCRRDTRGRTEGRQCACGRWVSSLCL